MNANTHCFRVLMILQRGDTISQLEASRWDDACLRLAARVNDLRTGKYDGKKYDVQKMTEKNADGKGTHARYYLPLVKLPPAFAPKPEPKAAQTNSLFT